MDLKVDLQQWNRACQAFDSQNYMEALETLLQCRPSSKTFFNAGMILVTLHDYQHAVEVFNKAIEHDRYFSAAYFQLGVSNVMLDNLEKAIACFDSAYSNLRGNRVINYRQLGLDFTLYACEVLYNRGICHLNMGSRQTGMEDLDLAQQLKMNHQHEIIDQVIQNPAHSTLGVYSIPPGVIYRFTECQKQLLDGVDALSVLYQCDRRATAAAQGILLLDQQHYNGGGISKAAVGSNQYPRGLPARLTKYLPTVITKDKTGRTKVVSPSTATTTIATKTIPHVLYPSPQPSTSPAPPAQAPSFFKSRQDHQTNSEESGTPTTANENSVQSTNHNTSGGEILKLKLHYKDTRVLLVHAHSTFQELLLKSQEKLNVPPPGLKLYCKGDNDQWVQLVDDKGWSFAKNNNKRIITACRSRSTNKDKIEIWCTT
ncbi:hypothetical protein [Absidia glauca]|uniref:Uncharacterized protein n=1 Tax=Absidia glauca TaxID=4829 RepID=A0A168T9X3_ABSGL|nr:hypothetical protein [Absidia glauca]